MRASNEDPTTFQTSVRMPGGRLWWIPAHRIDGYGHDVEETGLALCDPAPGTVHERADGLAQGLLTVALAEHLLRGRVCKWVTMSRQKASRNICQSDPNHAQKCGAGWKYQSTIYAGCLPPVFRTFTVRV